MHTTKQSVYLQIVDNFKKQIELGLLKENDKLPSCREMAISLGINPNTVQRAYSALEEEAYIFTIPKKGVYVSSRDKKADTENACIEKICELKNAGFGKEMLINAINKVFKEDL